MAMGWRTLGGLRSGAAGDVTPLNLSILSIAVIVVASAAGLYQLLAIAAALTHRRRDSYPIEIGRAHV